jgi:hypothetical protein
VCPGFLTKRCYLLERNVIGNQLPAFGSSVRCQEHFVPYFAYFGTVLSKIWFSHSKRVG